MRKPDLPGFPREHPDKVRARCPVAQTVERNARCTCQPARSRAVNRELIDQLEIESLGRNSVTVKVAGS